MSNKNPPLKGLAYGITFATEFSVALFFFGYIGNYFDSKYGTSGIFFALGIFLGLLVGGVRLYSILKYFKDKDDKEN